MYKAEVTFYNVNDRQRTYAIQYQAATEAEMNEKLREYIKNEASHWIVYESTPVFGVGVSEVGDTAYVYQRGLADAIFERPEFILESVLGSFLNAA